MNMSVVLYLRYPVTDLLYNTASVVILCLHEFSEFTAVGCMQTVEKRPREMMLRREFTNAVGYLNQMYPEERRLKFIHWDFHKFAKRLVHALSSSLEGFAT
jgi:hypothetical protein